MCFGIFIYSLQTGQKFLPDPADLENDLTQKSISK